MVLTSIIVGLGIARILGAVGGMVDRWTGHGEPLKPSVAHAAWLAYVFQWMILFWWWEFRFSEIITQWTLGLYSFIVLYAVLLFFLSVVLLPRNFDGVTDLDAYFLSKRRWFYGALLLTGLVDIGDSLLKGGWDYFLGTAPSLQVSLLVICVVGVFTSSLRFHALMGVGYFVWAAVAAFGWAPRLGLG